MWIFILMMYLFTQKRESDFLTLNKVLNEFKQENVKLKLRKCHFLLEEITYLGYNIKKNLVTPDPNNIIAVRNFPTPTTIKKLQQFLGMINVYHRFIKDYAKTTSRLGTPLNNLLTKNVKWN